jgi:hypothetical protein
VVDPTYVAVIECFPVVLKEVCTVAIPEFSAEVPSNTAGLVVVSSKLTFPVAAEGVTVAVKVTLSPVVGAVADASSAMVVDVRLGAVTVMVTALETLAASFASPP